MGTSIVYQAEVNFPTPNPYFNLKEKKVYKDVLVENRVFIADDTGSNYRYITFVSESGVDTDIEIEGLTIFNNLIKETITLNGDTPVNSTNLFKQFTLKPKDNIDSLNVGYGLGMSEMINYDGSPTSHRVIVNGGGSVNYTVYGLLTNKKMNKTTLDAQKFAISDSLSGETASTPTFVLVSAPATKLFLEVSTLAEETSIDWKFNTQSLL